MGRFGIAVVGGGRWARGYVRLLLSQSDLVRSVSIISPRNADGMRSWIAEEGLEGQASVASEWTPQDTAIDAAIIVNSAADHEAWAERFLEARVPVLIEKPFAMSAAGAARLIDLAQAQDVYLAAALVFKFARYLDRFAAVLPDRSEIRSVSVTWTDASGERRHGERKSYDPSVPVLADVLPHVVSVLDTLFPAKGIACDGVAAKHAGAQTNAGLSLDGTSCAIRLARNSHKRVRLIEVATDRQRFALDFSIEPGRISLNGESQSGDPDWDREPSPLTRLVRSFLNAVSGGARDDRLDARLGLLACGVTDQALRHYYAALFGWLSKTSGDGTLDERDLDYAMAEIGAVRIGGGQLPIDQLIEAVKRRAEDWPHPMRRPIVR